MWRGPGANLNSEASEPLFLSPAHRVWANTQASSGGPGRSKKYETN